MGTLYRLDLRSIRRTITIMGSHSGQTSSTRRGISLSHCPELLSSEVHYRNLEQSRKHLVDSMFNVLGVHYEGRSIMLRGPGIKANTEQVKSLIVLFINVPDLLTWVIKFVMKKEEKLETNPFVNTIGTRTYYSYSKTFIRWRD